MSTRASILIKDSQDQVRLYHHHDGYPEGVGADLVGRLKTKGNYCYVENFANKLIKDLDDEYELTNSIHGDEDYLYEVDTEKRTVKCTKRDGTPCEIPV